MNLLIIGGSGHVSGTLAQAALGGGHDVWTITSGKRPLPEGVNPIISDRHDYEALTTIVAGEEIVWDLVVDCICYDVPDIRQDIELFRHRARQFVFISTDFVYAPTQRTFPQPENTDHYVQTGDGSISYGLKKRFCDAGRGSVLGKIQVNIGIVKRQRCSQRYTLYREPQDAVPM